MELGSKFIMTQHILQVDALLRDFINSLSSCDGSEAFQKLQSADTVKMILDALDVIAKSKDQESVPCVVEKMANLLIIANDTGKESKLHIVSSLLGALMDFIVSSCVLIEYRLEILKNVNILLENCPSSTRYNLLSEDVFLKKLNFMFTAIFEAGDYEFQVCIIECLFRVIPKPIRAEITEKVKPSESLGELFLTIRDNQFETDCRRILNKVNAQNTSNSSRVYSFPAEGVKIDGEKIYKPLDEDYDQFWIDFNTSSQRVGLFIEPNFPQSQSGEVMWETVSLSKHDVARCSCTAQGALWKGVIEMKPGALIYSNKDPDDQSHLVVILVSNTYPLQDALAMTFRDICDNSKTKNPPKSSANDYSALLAPDRSNNSMPMASQQSRRGAKTSVPMVPMRTPASSVILSSSQSSPRHQISAVLNKTSIVNNNVSQAKTCEQNTAPESNDSFSCEMIQRPVNPSKKDVDSEQLKPLVVIKCSMPTCSVAKSDNFIKDGAEEIAASYEETLEYSPLKAASQTKTKSSQKTTEQSSQNSQRKERKKTSKKDLPVEKSKPSPRVTATFPPSNKAGSLSPEDTDYCTLRRSQRNSCKKSSQTSTPEQTFQQEKAGEQSSRRNLNVIKDATQSKRSNSKDRVSPEKSEEKPSNSHKKNSKETSESVQPSTKNVKTPPSKNLRSGKKVKTPVVTIQASNKKLDSKPQIEAASAKGPDDALTSCTKELVMRRKKEIPPNNLPTDTKEMVQEATISSVYEEKKRKASKNKDVKSQHKHNKSASSMNEEFLRKSLISPGNVSEEDFKVSKTIASLKKTKGSKTKSTMKEQIQMKRSAATQGKDKEDVSDKCLSCFDTSSNGKPDHENEDANSTKADNHGEKSAVCKSKAEVFVVNAFSEEGHNSENRNRVISTRSVKDDEHSTFERKVSERDAFGDQNKGKFNRLVPEQSSIPYHGCNKKEKSAFQPPSQLKVTGSKPESHSERVFQREKTNQMNAYSKRDKGTAPDCNNGSTSKIETAKLPDSKISSRTTNKALRLEEEVSLDDVSSSCSGFLYIETDHATADPQTDVVVETQCDKVSPNSLNSPNCPETQNDVSSSAPIEPTQELHKNTPNKLQKMSTMKSKPKLHTDLALEEDELNASGDYNLPNTEPQISSNMESSYVFDKFGAGYNISKRPTEFKRTLSPVLNQECVAKKGNHTKQDMSQTLSNQEQYDNIKREKMRKNNALALPISGCGDGVESERKESPSREKAGRLVRQLRECNKKISYKEWESIDDEVTPNKGSSTKHSTPFFNDDQGKNIGSSCEKSPSENKHRSQDQEAMKLVGAMAPKKPVRDSSKQKKTIWRSKEVKTTVTTTSYSKLIKSSFPSDPYSFDAECATSSTEAAPLLPFRSFSFNNSTLDQIPSLEFSSQGGKTKATNLEKEKIGHYSKNNSACHSKTTHMKTLHCDETQTKISNTKTDCAKRSKALAHKKGKKKAIAKESVEMTLFSSQTSTAKKKSKTNSARGSTEFTLFSSQKSQVETSKSSSGLVFPPLEDSIPCTPYDDIHSVASGDANEDGHEIKTRNSAVSELSWTKAKTPASVQKKMRGKTYNKGKTKMFQHETDEEDGSAESELEYGPLYQSLQKKLPPASHQTPQRQKVLRTLNLEITPGRSPGLASHYKKTSSKKSHSNDKELKTVSSILTNSAKRSSNLFNKKSIKSLSFKSPSDHEDASSAEIPDSDDASRASPDCLTNRALCLKNLRTETMEDELQSVSNPDKSKTAFSVSTCSDKSWHALSAKLDYHLQEVLDKVSDCLDQDECPSKMPNTLCSGPPSAARPRTSYLKRKYADLISSSSDHEDMSDTDHSRSKSALVPRKLFKADLSPRSILKWNNKKCTTPKTPKKKLGPASSSLQLSFSPGITTSLTPGRKSFLKKSPPKLNHSSPERKKRKSQRKLELLPDSKNPDEMYKSKSNSTRSLNSFDLSLQALSPPEINRDCTHLVSDFENEPGMSPYIPLSVSMDDSLLIGFSHLSSPHMSDISEKHESPPAPVALLDTIKDDLMKPLASQNSEGSSEDYCNQLLDTSETCSSQVDSHTTTHTAYSSLRDLLTKKNMVKPSLVTELDNATRPTFKCITSKWDEERKKRMTAVARFQSVIENALASISRDIKEINECEKAAMMLWEQQAEKLRKQRQKQEKEVKKLRSAYGELREQLQQTESGHSGAQRVVKASLKKDVEAFKKKLEDKYNEHSLEAMKRCLQTSFLFS